MALKADIFSSEFEVCEVYKVLALWLVIGNLLCLNVFWRMGFSEMIRLWLCGFIERVLYDLKDIWNTTLYPKASDPVNTDKPCFFVDPNDKILSIANHIRGKNLASYTPSVDMGAFMIVVNAEKVVVFGKKRNQKLYRRHSGRPSGMTVETFDQLQQRIP